MLSSSKRILRNRNFLEVISYKVSNASYLHVYNAVRIQNTRRILNVPIEQQLSGFNATSLVVTRLLSTNTEGTAAAKIQLQDVSTQTVSIDTIKQTSSSINVSGTNELKFKTTESLVSSSGNVDSNVLTGQVNATSNVSPAVEQKVNASPEIVQSQKQVVQEDVSEFPIPDPPLPQEVTEAVKFLGGDPPFEYLGLTGWSPVGLIQSGFEFLHVTAGLPWWGCIIAATVLARSLMFPIVVMSQRSGARMSNNLPKFQELQAKVNESKQRGDFMESARYSQDMIMFMREKNINPLKNAAMPLIQAPVFISFFMSLREMANLPVKSMHNEGLFWFTDLTVPDQYYLLPIITSMTMLATIEVGSADSSRMASTNSYLIKQILRCMPIAVFPFTVNFPGAILIYWCTSNFISLGQASLFRVQKARDFLKIERRIVHPTDPQSQKSKGVIQNVKDWWKSTRTQSVVEDRSRKNKLNFTSAGRGAVPKTYSYDPTISRPVQPAVGVQAKKSS